MSFLGGVLFGALVGAAIGFLVGAYSFVPGDLNAAPNLSALEPMDREWLEANAPFIGAN